MEQERIQRLIEEDDRREKAEEAAPVPELMSVGSEQAVDIEMSGRGAPSASDSTPTIAADPTASNNTGQVTSENSKNQPSNVSTSWYTEMPDTLVIKRSKKRGRGLWTKEFVRAGEHFVSFP